MFASNQDPSHHLYALIYMYHHHHHHYHDHHVHVQVHHGQPGHVHGPADAIQANVCRHRPHWKVIMIMITLMTLVMKTFPKANNSDEQFREDVCTDFKLSFISVNYGLLLKMIAIPSSPHPHLRNKINPKTLSSLTWLENYAAPTGQWEKV